MAESSEDRILYVLKSRGAQTASGLGQRLGITPVGARQHLVRLERLQLVTYEDRREAVGRPRRYWSLTESGHGRFPDAHSHLTLELLNAIRKVFGEDGLERLIAEREEETLASYQRALAGSADFRAKLKKLASLRDREGYMAEWKSNKDGSFFLIENHCPICAAAAQCQGLCRSELELFQTVLGEDVVVDRCEHMLAGARRCAYRITPRQSDGTQG